VIGRTEAAPSTKLTLHHQKQVFTYT